MTLSWLAYVAGWEAVSARFGRTATSYAAERGGGQSAHENIVSWVSDNLACSVTIERHESRLGGQDLLPFSVRQVKPGQGE